MAIIWHFPHKMKITQNILLRSKEKTSSKMSLLNRCYTKITPN